MPEALKKTTLFNLVWPKINRTGKNLVSYWSDGTPYIIKPGSNIFIPKQREFFDAMYKYDAVLFGGAAGPGKALDIDTPLPTPTGWTTMGAVQPGDYLIDDEGNPSEVFTVSKIEEREAFRVTFSDGEELIASGDHLWETSTYSERSRAHKSSDEFRANRRANRPSRGTGARLDLAERNRRNAGSKNLPLSGIRTTEEIKKTLYSGKRLNHSVRVGEALELPEADLPIEPYTLGAWLGDGTGVTGAISGLDDGVFREIERDGYEVVPTPSTKGMTRRIIGLTKKLRILGVQGNKHIPIAYQRSSVQQRIALLQGLMDTDGHCDKNGCAEFTSTNKFLFNDVRQIVISLGLQHGYSEGKATLNGRYISQKYRLVLSSCPIALFRLQRKLKRQKRIGRWKKPVRFIASVESVGIRKVKCVGIDSPSHLYRAGLAMIPTHNTYALLWALALICRKLAAPCKENFGIPIRNPRVVLFSSTFKTLRDRHLKKIDDYFPKWMGQLYMSNPPEYRFCEEWGGGQILFRNLSDPDEYKSVEFAAIAFDEITENEEHVYDAIRIRKRYDGVARIPMLAATNPTGVGRDWVFDKFVNPETSEKEGDNYEVLDSEGKPYHYQGYYYLASVPTDNPTLAPSYLDELSRMPEEDKAAYFHGSWKAFQGQFFHLVPEIHQFDEDTYLPEEWLDYRGIDAGYGHPTVCLWGKVDFEGDIWIHREYSVTGQYAEYHKKHIAEMSVEEKYHLTVGDPKMWGGDRSSASNKTWREIFNDDKDGIGSFNMVKAKASQREERWQMMLQAFGYESEWIVDKEGVKHRNIIRRPKIHISTACLLTWNSLTSRRHDQKNPDVVAKTQGLYKPGRGDDEADVVSYLLMAARGKYGTKELDPKYLKQFEKNRTYAPNDLNRAKNLWTR